MLARATFLWDPSLNFSLTVLPTLVKLIKCMIGKAASSSIPLREEDEEFSSTGISLIDIPTENFSVTKMRQRNFTKQNQGECSPLEMME